MPVIVLPALLLSTDVHAEPVADRLLSNVTVVEKNACSVVKIDFNSRIQYMSHFPIGTGDELRIQIKPFDNPANGSALRQESLRAPANERAAIHAIELDTVGTVSTMTLYFKRNVAFHVAQGLDFKSIVISIAGANAPGVCQTALDEVAGSARPGAAGGVTANLAAKGKQAPAGPLVESQLDQTMGEARTALEKSNPDRAVQLLTKVIEAGATPHKKEAQELLGLARERRGQTAHARAEYQEYLRQFPAGDGADRVKARLAAIDGGAKPVAGSTAPLRGTAQTASDASGSGLRLGNEQSKETANAISGVYRGAADGTRLAEVPKPYADATITHYGSVSTYYNLNQGGRGFIETPRTNVGWDKDNPYKTYQNSLLSNIDYDGRYDNAAYAARLKVSASEQTNLMANGTNETRVSAFFLDGRVKEAGVTGRIGRQTATSGGVYGRFDGAAAGYQASEHLRLGAVGGSPVERSKDAPFVNDKYFYGVSAEYSGLAKSLQSSGYFIEQRAEGMIDRQSIGSELRYVDNGTAAYGNVEYDVHFNQVNSTTVTGSQIFQDQSTASVNLDYRRAPLLSVTNALQGQGVYKLSELLRRYTTSEFDQLALDRSAQSYTGTASVSRPINAALQWTADVTANYLSGMPASGGIDAVRSIGAGYYASTQLIGTGVVFEGDTMVGGLRFASTTTSDRYMIDFGVSNPINPSLRIHPMVKFGYVTYKNEDRSEYQLIPTFRTVYSMTPSTIFELEAGGKFILTESPIGRDSQNEFLLLAGVRYDFSNGR